MLVSVVIAALNEEKYIGKTLETLLLQKTTHEFEIIVGDGYSSDRTVEIAESFGAKIAMEHRHSASWERQAGAKIAKGEIIAFTDADAQIPEGWIESIASAFLEKDIVMVYGPVYFSDSSGIEKNLSKIVMDIFLTTCSLAGLHNPIGSNIGVRRKVFEKINGFNTNLVTAEDLDLAKRISKYGKLKFSSGIFAFVSARRIKKWGYLYFSLFHIVNALRFHFTGSSQKKYDPVR